VRSESPVRRYALRAALLYALCVLPSAGCGRGGGGPQTISKDGYRAILVFSPEDRYSVAVRGEARRVEGEVEGSTLVKIVRPDLGKVWQFRPDTEKILEAPYNTTEEIVPGYPLEPNFDAHAYAGRFGGVIEQISDATHGLHPSERWVMTLPSGDRVTLWVAKDLERLVVRIEHAKKDTSDEHQPFSDTQLLDVRVGAKPELFEPPRGFQPVKAYEELNRK
jgi:hypothetical protein